NVIHVGDAHVLAPVRHAPVAGRPEVATIQPRLLRRGDLVEVEAAGLRDLVLILRGQDLLSCLPGAEPERIPAHLGEELHEPLDSVIQCRGRLAGLSRAGPALLRRLERHVRANLNRVVEETPGIDGAADEAVLPALAA